MRTLLASAFFFVAIARGPTCAVEGLGPAATNDPPTAAVETRLDSIIIDRFGVPVGPATGRSIQRQLAFLTMRSQLMDPAHLGVRLRLRESPVDPQLLSAPVPTGNPACRPMQSWQYVPLRELLNYICKANGLNYDIEDGQVVLFHPDQKAIIL